MEIEIEKRKIDKIKCSTCGNEIWIEVPTSLLKLSNIIKTANERNKCCDNPNYAPYIPNI